MTIVLNRLKLTDGVLVRGSRWPLKRPRNPKTNQSRWLVSRCFGGGVGVFYCHSLVKLGESFQTQLFLVLAVL